MKKLEPNCAAPRGCPRADALHDQLGPFESLHSDERCAKCRCDQHQGCGFGAIAAVTEIDGHRHRPLLLIKTKVMMAIRMSGYVCLRS